MLIALTGLAGSGKSTVAKLTGFVEMAFAAPMKEFCGQVFGFTDEELYGPSEARERPSKTFKRPDGTPLTARYALQTLGTEWGRNCDPDVWAKACLAGAKKAMALGSIFENVVITDLRFVNEARLVREAGGFIWRVNRYPFEASDNGAPLHASEREVYSDEMDRLVDYTIHNYFGLHELKMSVEEAVNQFRKGADCGN